MRTADRVLILRQPLRIGQDIQHGHLARQPVAESRKRKAPPWSDGEVVILERCRPYSFWRARRARQGNGKPRRPIGTSGAVQRAANLEWSLQPLLLARLTGTGKRRSSPVWKVVAAVPIRKR